MARYFLHYHDGTDRVIDPDGMEFADLGTAEQEAIRAAREIIASEVRTGRVDLGAWIDLEDEAGTVVKTIRFRSVVEILQPELRPLA